MVEETNKVLKFIREPGNVVDIGITFGLFCSLLATNGLISFWYHAGTVENDSWIYTLSFMIITMIVFLVVPILIYLEIVIIRNRDKLVKLSKSEITHPENR